MTGKTILHITARVDWDLGRRQGAYMTPSLADEGFIHCSTHAQTAATANRYFRGREGLVVLEIEVARLQSELKYEKATNGDLFPHIYGPLNLDAVTRVLELKADADGTFKLPGGLSES